MEEFKVTETKEYQYLNETFPHVAAKIAALWGTIELVDYFNDLLMDTREGTRRGFPPTAANHIFFLYDIHSCEYPELRRDVRDPWELGYIRDDKWRKTNFTK